jgi:parvulin-like peptidyl-prolyl isomerase
MQHQPLNIMALAACMALWAGLGWVTSGCTPTGKPPADESASRAVVAHIGSGAISAADFKGYLAEHIPAYQALTIETDVRRRLEDLVVEEVLYQEGLRLGLDRDPRVKRRIRQMIAQHLLDKQVTQKAWSRKITEAELQAYYDQQSSRFNRPDQVRLADIFIAVPPQALPEERQRLQHKAQQILAEAVDARQQRSGFGRLIQKYSDTPDKYALGDTGFIDMTGGPRGIDPRLAAAGFEIEENGGIYEQVIEADDGFHVIMRIGKRSAVHQPFQKVRPQLEQAMRREEAQTRRKAYIEALQRQADIQIEEAAMAAIVQEMQAQRGGLAQGGQPARPTMPGN